MLSMITPRIKPSAFFQDQPATDLFVREHRQAKLDKQWGAQGQVVYFRGVTGAVIQQEGQVFQLGRFAGRQGVCALQARRVLQCKGQCEGSAGGGGQAQ